jgi:GTP-binding protein
VQTAQPDSGVDGVRALRNVAIIAHVDHGKTTLVDRLLQQSGSMDARAAPIERAMDSDDLERERGITILSKTTAVTWRGYRINIVDTPGHADFGRFVTQKAFARGLKAIVVINKIDRPGARPDWVLNETFDLFDRLDATEEQLDFPVVYASAFRGYAGHEANVSDGDMTPLFETIVEQVPPPPVDRDGPFQMQVSSLDYSSYVGAIGIGRIARGSVGRNSPVVVVDRDGHRRNARILQVLRSEGLERRETERASAGDIVAVTGIEAPNISDTLCDPEAVEALPPLTVDEPTVSMDFLVNTSPLAGRDGRFLTSRQIRERLARELIHNVALRVEDTGDPDRFLVSGRGELHLAILIENMRREGYELAISRPRVILREIDGQLCEPFEQLTVDVEEAHQGTVMELLGTRRGALDDMRPDGRGRVRLDYRIPARGLIGFRTEFLTSTSGTGLIYHTFSHYGPCSEGNIAQRGNGALVANSAGRSLAYALFNLQERGRMLVGPGEDIYEGMIVGIHSRANDLVVNPMKAKQLTNIRAAGSDENILLTPPIRLTLEQALELIDDDELVEVTPKNIRVRKKLLKEHERKRASRAAS